MPPVSSAQKFEKAVGGEAIICTKATPKLNLFFSLVAGFCRLNRLLFPLNRYSFSVACFLSSG